MKRFTPYTIGRGIGKLIACLVLSFVVAAGAGAVYADYQADKTAGVEHVQFENDRDNVCYTHCSNRGDPRYSLHAHGHFVGFPKAARLGA